MPPVRARFLTVAFLFLALLGGAPGARADQWVTRAADDSPQVHLYFFWSERCPHCQVARPFVEELAAGNRWIELHSLEVTKSRDNAIRYVEMAKSLGENASSVPGFIFCGRMYTGFDSPQGVGRLLEAELQACRTRAAATSTSAMTGTEPRVEMPALGGLDLRSLSLPVVTLVIAGLDAFNPCAFFVLLFLLSLLVHERTRTRMLVIGGVFVLFSGLVYFALMAAWLNLFMVAGELRVVTLAAGAIALFMAVVNIKDYLWFKRGLSLSIPESAKPKLYERVRGLLRAQSWPVMLAGTVTLAVAANSYEALCTAGFPMVYTRLLTLQGLSTGAYYGYLALYNVIYVLPLLAIVGAFAWSMGSRKLTEGEGRVLKLVSGVMMLGLGGALLVAPESLNDPGAAVVLLAVALAAGWWGWRRERAAR
jgi:hypothetical protein